MRNIRTQGIVIKRQNTGEADKILTVFTREQGKIKIKATGIRKITSRRSPHVELLNLANLSLYKGTHMSILTEAQVIDSFSDLKKNLTRVSVAYHMCELIDGLTAENQENIQVFYLLQNTLSRLCTEMKLRLLVNEFEVELLQILGFWYPQRDLATLSTQDYIEDLLERKLKTKQIFAKLN